MLSNSYADTPDSSKHALLWATGRILTQTDTSHNEMACISTADKYTKGALLNSRYEAWGLSIALRVAIFRRFF